MAKRKWISIEDFNADTQIGERDVKIRKFHTTEEFKKTNWLSYDSASSKSDSDSESDSEVFASEPTAAHNNNDEIQPGGGEMENRRGVELVGDTLDNLHINLALADQPAHTEPDTDTEPDMDTETLVSDAADLLDQAQAVPVQEVMDIKIEEGNTGYSYESLYGPHMENCTSLTLQDSDIMKPHQIDNFLHFGELAAEKGIKEIHIITSTYRVSGENEAQIAKGKKDQYEGLETIRKSLEEYGVKLTVTYDNLHRREIRFDNGWIIVPEWGLDMFQPYMYHTTNSPHTRSYNLGHHRQSLRKCKRGRIEVKKCDQMI